MNVSNACFNVGDVQQLKAAFLRDAPGVTRLEEVWCFCDHAWSLELLERAAPSVEQLSVLFPVAAHLLAMHAMPRLKRLHLTCTDGRLDANPPVLPALPPGHAGLQWLRVRQDLPYATLQSLLRAHGHSLEKLQLNLGTAERGLHSLLEPCGLRALRRLVLTRNGELHRAGQCVDQRARVLRVLPGAEVLCDECDDVEVEDL